MSSMSPHQKLASASRTAFLVLAALEGYLFFGMTAVSLLIGLHLGPSDPGPAGTAPDYGPWHATPEVLLVGLGCFTLGLPAGIGMWAILDKRFPRRSVVIPIATAAMVLVALLTVVFFSAGWDLGSIVGSRG
jgi:hypothetical protein